MTFIKDSSEPNKVEHFRLINIFKFVLYLILSDSIFDAIELIQMWNLSLYWLVLYSALRLQSFEDRPFCNRLVDLSTDC